MKGKIALLRKPAILRRRWTHVPKNQLLTGNQGQEVLKGSFKDIQAKRGGYVQNSTASSKSNLEISHGLSDHLDCFNYS